MAAANSRTAASLAQQLQQGHRVILNGVTVKGPLDLARIDSVKSIFECHSCTFTGPCSRTTRSSRNIDLMDPRSTKEWTSPAHASRSKALFRAGLTKGCLGKKPPCRFRGPARFSLTVFDDLASFARTRFCDRADFRDARFADASFSRSWFTAATFARSSFRGSALFNDAHFDQPASYEEADFRTRADFARTEFRDGGDFADSRFADGATFLAARFKVKDADEAISSKTPPRAETSTSRSQSSGKRSQPSRSRRCRIIRAPRRRIRSDKRREHEPHRCATST
jgi:hypothetical protein